MALLTIDGFDTYATEANFSQNSNFYNILSVTPSTTTPYGEGKSAEVGYGGFTIRSPSGVQPILIFGMSVLGGDDGTQISFQNGTTINYYIKINIESSRLDVFNADTILLGSTDFGTWNVAIWNYLEVKGDGGTGVADGNLYIQINGELQLTINDTLLGFSDNLQISNFTPLFLDNFYLCDGTTGDVVPNNDFLGDCQVTTMFPTADLNVQFTTTGSSNWQTVGTDDPNNISVNNYSDVVNAFDIFNTSGSIPLTSTIYGVTISSYAFKNSSGVRSVGNFTNSLSSNYNYNPVWLSPSPQYINNVSAYDPAWSVAWTPTTVNGLAIGYEVIT